MSSIIIVLILSLATGCALYYSILNDEKKRVAESKERYRLSIENIQNKKLEQIKWNQLKDKYRRR